MTDLYMKDLFERVPHSDELKVERALHKSNPKYEWDVRKGSVNYLIAVKCTRQGCHIVRVYSESLLQNFRELKNPATAFADVIGECKAYLDRDVEQHWRVMEELQYALDVSRHQLENPPYRSISPPYVSPMSVWDTPLVRMEEKRVSKPKPTQEYLDLQGCFERLSEEYDRLEYHAGCVIDHATGGRMSKTNYETSVVYKQIDCHVEHLVEQGDSDAAEDHKEAFAAAEGLIDDLRHQLRSLRAEGCKTGLMNVPDYSPRKVCVQTDEDGDIG